MRNIALLALFVLVLGLPAAAQNLIVNGDFEQGRTGWTTVKFNDPLGTTGVRRADTNGNSDSNQALYADFQTLTPVMESRWDSTKFSAAAGTYPLTADIMWEKKVTTPIPYSSLNLVQFIIRSATTNQTIVTLTQGVPNHSGLQERVTLQGNVTFASSGTYIMQIFMRHSNAAGIPFFNYVDDVAMGEFGGTISASGSAQTGGTTDLMLRSPGAANRFYVAGSSLGQGPFPIDSRWIGLSPDPIFAISVSGFAPAVFQSYSGALSNTGTATAKLNIPGAPVLVGLKIHSAYVTLDPQASSGIGTISNTVGITLQ